MCVGFSHRKNLTRAALSQATAPQSFKFKQFSVDFVTDLLRYLNIKLTKMFKFKSPGRDTRFLHNLALS